MAEENFQERTEQASPRRREKAREEGQVAKSVELNGALMVGLGCAALMAIGPMMASQLSEVMRQIMAHAGEENSLESLSTLTQDNIFRFLIVSTPMMLILLLIGVGSSVAQVGFHISPKALEPRLDRFNLMTGLKRLFSMRSGVQLIRDSLKLLIIGVIAYFIISSEMPTLLGLSNLSVPQVASMIGSLSLGVGIKIGGAMLALAGLDYFYQKYEFEKSIRMSKQELKEEYRDTEGSPQLKARVRQLQRDVSRRRMMSAVPTADVVITNPTHLAIALKYDPESMTAPTVVAKGERLIALKIKEIALAHGVPVIEDKPLARALYKSCEIGQLVPQALYRAAAEVLAYVYRLKNGQEADR